jgi:hypothetical protein
MALSDPLERGQDAWHLTQGQLDLEDQTRQLWEDYLTKRVPGGNQQAGTGLMPPPRPRHATTRHRGVRVIGQIGTSVTGRNIGVPATHVSDGFGHGT